MVWVAPGQQIHFGTDPGPTALCELVCIGGFGLEENKKYSAAICEKLQKDLGIPPER